MNFFFFTDFSDKHGRMCVYERYAPGPSCSKAG